MSDKQFLPLCDLLFNIISLASYFCDLVFDLTSAYALYTTGKEIWCYLIIFFVGLSLLLVQGISLKWFLSTTGTKCGRFGLLLVHACQSGILWRYFKLFLPVDLSCVKFEVRDLCILRMIHAFSQSAPLLLIELHLFLSGTLDKELRELNLVSVCLSLFSVSWALASFSKNVKVHNVHKLVLTWLGVIFQLSWRLCTVGCRACALVLYSSAYGRWVIVVLVLHWLAMFLLLACPDGGATEGGGNQENHVMKRTSVSAVIATVYIFSYVNIQERQQRSYNMIIFYVVMTLENLLLCFSWYLSLPDRTAVGLKPLALIPVYCLGFVFMGLYYRYFHVRRLKYEHRPRTIYLNQQGQTESSMPSAEDSPNGEVVQTETQIDLQPEKNHHKSLTRYRYYGGLGHNHHNGVPGVFNCRFTNPYAAKTALSKRKKKKPTSFVPPPTLIARQRCPLPFWCGQIVTEEKPGSSQSEIQAKLEEKKKQQMAELRDLEEEMLRHAYPQQLQPNAYLCRLEPETIPYTLPRQTRYFKRNRKHIKTSRYCPPANSSDGDVDSGDEVDDQVCCSPTAAQLKLNARMVKHETKL